MKAMAAVKGEVGWQFVRDPPRSPVRGTAISPTLDDGRMGGDDGRRLGLM